MSEILDSLICAWGCFGADEEPGASEPGPFNYPENGASIIQRMIDSPSCYHAVVLPRGDMVKASEFV
jgi:hypothetical protein